DEAIREDEGALVHRSRRGNAHAEVARPPQVLHRRERPRVVDEQGVQRAARAWFGRSVMNMCPGLWVIMNGGRDASATACGVTPHAQNTGVSPGRTPTKSPQSGWLMSAIPIAVGSPTCTGAPWAFG